MFKKLASILFILCVFGLLVLNRFDLSPKVIAKINRDDSTSGNPTYSIGHTFKNGETISTHAGEFIKLQIGYLIELSLDENTNVKLKSLSKNNVRIGFGHGRILVFTSDGGSINIDTPTAQHKIETSSKLSAARENMVKATFVGYDFNHLTSVIPIVGVIHTIIPLLDREMDVTSPINIHDENPPIVESTKFDRNAGVYKAFYDWTEQK